MEEEAAVGVEGGEGVDASRLGLGSAACLVAERLNHSKWRRLRHPGLSCPARHGRYPERCQCHLWAGVHAGRPSKG